MTPTLPFSPTDRLIAALRGRGWVRRADIAGELAWTVRQVRIAANESRGAILACNDGLKLTLEASQSEVDECCGRFSSQVSAMTKRIVEIRAVWESLHHETV